MNEEQTYALEFDGQFFADDVPVWAHGTAGEILEQIADQMGIEDEEPGQTDVEFEGNSIFPSVRALRAHAMLEDRLGKSGAFDNPDSLMEALLREGFARRLTDAEVEAWMEEEEMDEYEEARGEIDDEWRDGVWET